MYCGQFMATRPRRPEIDTRYILKIAGHDFAARHTRVRKKTLMTSSVVLGETKKLKDRADHVPTNIFVNRKRKASLPVIPGGKIYSLFDS